MRAIICALLVLAGCERVRAVSKRAAAVPPVLSLVSVTPLETVTITFSSTRAGTAFLATASTLLSRFDVAGDDEITVSGSFPMASLQPGVNDVVVSIITADGARGSLTVQVTRPGGVDRSVGGTVSGLLGTGLVLALDLPGALPDQFVNVASNGAFSFPSSVPDGTVVTRVTVNALPLSPAQSCVVLLASGAAATGFAVSGANFSELRVTCASVAGNLRAVGGTVSGLKGGGLLLAMDLPGVANDQLQPLVVNGVFTFAGLLAEGTTVSSVSVIAIPTAPTQTCTVQLAAGGAASGFTVGATDFMDLRVQCTDAAANARAVGGLVSGLSGAGLVLSLGAQSVSIVGNGAFTFPAPVTEGTSVTASVMTQPSGQTCSVMPAGAVVIGATDYSDLRVTCAAPTTRMLSGTVSGLFGTGLTLALDAAVDQTLPLAADGAFSFATALSDGETVTSVTVSAQPTQPAQTCTVTLAGGAAATGFAMGASTALEVTCGARHPTEVPVIFFTDITSGPKSGTGAFANGAFITIYGERFGSTRPKVTIGGVEVASYGPYAGLYGENYAGGPRGLDRMYVQPGPAVPTGSQPLVVYRDGRSPSAAVTFTVNNGTASEVSTEPALASAMSSAQHGAVIYVHGGTYDSASSPCADATICFTGSRTAPGGYTGSATIALVGYPGETALIELSAAAQRLATVNSTGTTVVLANLTFGDAVASGDATDRAHTVRAQSPVRIVGNVFGQQIASASLNAIQLDLSGSLATTEVFGNRFDANFDSDNVLVAQAATITSADFGYNEFTLASTPSSSPAFGASIGLHNATAIAAARVHHNLFRAGEKAVFVQNGNYDDMGTNTPPFGDFGTIVIDNNVFFDDTVGFSHHAYFDIVRGALVFAHNSYYLTNATNGHRAVNLAYFANPSTGGPFNPTGVFANNAISATDTFFGVPGPSGYSMLSGLSFLANLYFPGNETLTTDAKKKNNKNPNYANAPGGDLSLSASSVDAIDQGDSAILGGVVIDTDYLGFPRPLGAERDIGAFEFVP